MTSIAIDRLDGLSSSTAIKGPCRVATTANITLSGTQTIDGVAVVADDRVLVKDQTATAENGIYVAAASAWRRSSDFESVRDIRKGSQVLVTDGTVSALSVWTVTSSNPVVVGTDSITFSQTIAPDTNTFDPGITGVTAPFISQRDKLRQNLTSGDIKALGDDSTDNAAVINNALSDLGGWGGGVLTLNMDRDNGGHYRVASALDVPSDVVLRGENRNVILDIDHNAAIGIDFAGISGTRNTHNGLFDITLQASASRDNTYELVRFQQIQDSAMVRVKFDGTPYSFNLFESLNVSLVDVEWDDCEYVDFTVGNAVDTFISRLYHIGNTSPSGLSKNALGQAFLSQNGTSGFYANHWLAVRKYRGFEWGKRSGATGKTSEHFTVFNAIADNCKDAGFYITDLFNASFSACAAMYCGNIDTGSDPNGELRNGVYMSATEHPTVASQPSTQNVHFDSACRIWSSSREGLYVKRSTGNYDPQFWSYRGSIGTSNLLNDADTGHIMIDSGYASDFSLDGVRFEPMEIKGGGGSYSALADHCIKFNGVLSNARVRLTNMLLGDVGGSTYVSGDISANAGVVVHGNNHLFWTSWTPTLSFGGGSTGITYTTQTGRIRKANGMVYLEGEILLSSKGTDTGAAVIGGLPVAPLGNAVGQVEFRSNGASIPTNGLSARSTTSSTLTLNYQGATDSAALTNSEFTDTSRLHFSIVYAAANP